MRLLALDLSSRFGSLALVEKENILAERSWEEDYKNRQQLFDTLNDLEADWKQVDGFVVGRGPGAFSGMRISLSVANALAAPEKKPVYVLNSGASMAAQSGAESTAVLGDARRNRVWAGIFKGHELDGEFRLLEYNEISGFIPPDARIISSDRERVDGILAGIGFRQADETVYPSAAILAQLAFRRLEQGLDPEPPEPLYMHPPVFVAPRFPA